MLAANARYAECFKIIHQMRVLSGEFKIRGLSRKRAQAPHEEKQHTNFIGPEDPSMMDDSQASEEPAIVHHFSYV
jgi:hypothetical protein